MQLDLRYPIGLLLSIYGAILALQGTLVGQTMLGVNVDLYWGVVMLACGLAVLGLARVRGRRRS